MTPNTYIGASASVKIRGKINFYSVKYFVRMNYSIYRCRDGKNGEVYVFVVLGQTLKESETITFQNMSGYIVRLKKIVRVVPNQ